MHFHITQATRQNGCIKQHKLHQEPLAGYALSLTTATGTSDLGIPQKNCFLPQFARVHCGSSRPPRHRVDQKGRYTREHAWDPRAQFFSARCKHCSLSRRPPTSSTIPQVISGYLTAYHFATAAPAPPPTCALSPTCLQVPISQFLHLQTPRFATSLFFLAVFCFAAAATVLLCKKKEVIAHQRSFPRTLTRLSRGRMILRLALPILLVLATTIVYHDQVRIQQRFCRANGHGAALARWSAIESAQEKTAGETTCQRPSCSNTSHFDALVVAGGGQTPTGPPTHVVLRLQKALEL